MTRSFFPLCHHILLGTVFYFVTIWVQCVYGLLFLLIPPFAHVKRSYVYLAEQSPSLVYNT